MYAVPLDRLFDEKSKLMLRGVNLSFYLYCCRLANNQPSGGDGNLSFLSKMPLKKRATKNVPSGQPYAICSVKN